MLRAGMAMSSLPSNKSSKWHRWRLSMCSFGATHRCTSCDIRMNGPSAKTIGPRDVGQCFMCFLTAPCAPADQHTPSRDVSLMEEYLRMPLYNLCRGSRSMRGRSQVSVACHLSWHRTCRDTCCASPRPSCARSACWSSRGHTNLVKQRICQRAKPLFVNCVRPTTRLESTNGAYSLRRRERFNGAHCIKYRAEVAVESAVPASRKASPTCMNYGACV